MVLDTKLYRGLPIAGVIYDVYMFINKSQLVVTAIWDDHDTTCRRYGRLKQYSKNQSIGVFQYNCEWLIVDLGRNKILSNEFTLRDMELIEKKISEQYSPKVGYRKIRMEG